MVETERIERSITWISAKPFTTKVRLYETVSSTTVNSSRHYFTSVENPKSYMNGALNEIRTRISTLRMWPPKPLVR